MAQADRVYITPPTNTSAIDHPMMFPPRDPTRRRFLAVAAVASVVSAGTLAAAAAMDPSVPAAVTIPRHSRPDPVFALIEAHRKAHAAHMASLELQNRFERRYGIGHGSWISTQPCHDEDDAFVAMVEAPATSLPGLSAKLAYLQGLGSEFETEWMIEDRADAGALVRSFAASIANVLAVLS
jgi:hypothetical protein